MSAASTEAAVEGLAGAGGAVVALVTTYPLLTINTRQQTTKLKTKKEGSEAKDEDEAKEEERGAPKDKQPEISFKGLYNGFKPALVGTLASNIVYFYLMGYLKAFWLARKTAAMGPSAQAKKVTPQLGVLESLLIASIAGCGNVLATNPIWILVTRMQANKSRKGAGKNNQAGASSLEGEEEEKKKEEGEGEGEGGESLTLTQTALKLYEESGVLGFWKGVLPSLIMVSNPSIQYMFFETLYNIRSNPKQGKAKTLSAFEVFQTSALAKLGATVITYPMLVVKSNMQNASSTSKKKSIASTVNSILDQEGPLGFYKGMRTKIFQSVFAASLLYMCKEEIKKGAKALVKSTVSKK